MSEIRKNQIPKKVFISYLDDNGQTISGFVDLLEANSSFVKFRTSKNIITIPSNRVLKIKENIEGDTDDRNG